MRTIEQKLASLNATSVWYFAKQDTNFDNAFKAVQIVEELGKQWEDGGTTAWSTRAASKGLDSNHRILSVAQLLGLLTKNNPFEKSQYKSETPTPVYKAICRYAIGSPEYNALKTEQLLKLRMNAITDTRPESADYNIAPVLFTYEVFWRLKAKGVTEISLGDFYTYVMTCKTHDEIDECVEYLLDPNRKDSSFVANYKSDSRVVTLIQNNLNLIQFTSTTVSIKPEFADYFGYFFNGAYTSFVNMMKYLVSDVQMYQTILTNPIGLAVNFLDPSAKTDIGVKRVNLENRKTISGPTQQIFYGAPGTGKSHKIKSEVDEKNKICYRTTFHPDSDYSTFVGAYKPSMKPTGTILASGEKEEIIKYTFVPQAFTKAYVHAWNTKDEVYLVIEEINRGNCAQIFGDLFQLLDRKNGFSEYPIDTDSDLEDHIKEKLETSTRDDIPEQVRAGKKLMLPSNLYIWATMNTSDQSLFPIDSAFKRRWDWVYTPIKQHDEEYKIVLGDDAEYDWWGFLEKINQVIDDATSSEDKKLGYFFVKAQDKVISAEKFVGKVLFYLWNDVFKNYGFDSPIFSKGGNKKFAFSDFFTGSGEPDTEMVKSFLKKLDETIDKEKPFTNDKSKVAVNPEEVAEQA